MLDDAEFLGSHDFFDTYYDNTSYSLTTQDIWLRSRGPVFQLKVPLGKAMGKNQRLAGRYEEIDRIDEIRERLKIPEDGPLQDDVEASGYRPFAHITTSRRTYRKEGIVIDEDYADFDFRIFVLRLDMTGDLEEGADPERMVNDFAKRFQLKEIPLRAKVVEYIRRSDRKHYDALAAAGLVDERDRFSSAVGAA
jgi:hypothetical protein